LTHYDYRAYGAEGRVEAGKIEAASEAEASRLLHRQNLRPFDIRESDGKNRRTLLGWEGIRRKSALDPARLFADLQILMEAGFAIDQALQASAAGMTEGPARTLVAAMVARLKAGEAFSRALASVPEVPKSTIAMIVSGEAGGQLTEVIASLAARLQDREKRRGEIRDALIYPAFLLVVMLLALGIITFVLAPALAPVFEGTGQSPPALVAALSAIRSFLLDWGWLSLAGLAVIVCGALLAARTQSGRHGLSKALVRLPVAGAIIRAHANEQYLFALALLLGHGVAMTKALELSAETSIIASFRPQLDGLRDQVASGRRLKEAMAACGVFDHVTLAMVSIGDDSNRLADSLMRAATLLGNRAKKATDRFLAILTPTITILVGGLIGMLVLSVMNALLGINAMALR
jgi:general secretion pathway protein F